MSTPTIAFLAGVLLLTTCNVAEDEPQRDEMQTSVETQSGPTDRELCYLEFEELDCPAGLGPQLHFDGGSGKVVLIEEHAQSLGNNTALVDLFGQEGWIATDLMQNSQCTVGCFAECSGKMGCLVNPDHGNSCWYCSSEVIEQDCRDFGLACQGIDPNDG